MTAPGRGLTTRRELAWTWVGIAVSSGAFLLFAASTRSALDDPDPARQRPGLLDTGSLPERAPLLRANLPMLGQRAVVIFVRSQDLGPLCKSLPNHGLERRAAVVAVVSGPGECEAAITINDPKSQFSRRFGLAQPRAAGSPVGYALIDRAGQIRYRTLDPTVVRNLTEVETVLRAIP